MTPDIPADGPFPGTPGKAPPTLACSGAASRPELGDDCWFLAGPTAAGKTSLGIRMAERLRAEIVSVDSMAVYRGLDIGTAKPGPAERSRLPHHLVDVVAPSEAYNVARWLADVTTAIAGIRARGRQILFVGGTPPQTGPQPPQPPVPPQPPRAGTPKTVVPDQKRVPPTAKPVP